MENINTVCLKGKITRISAFDSQGFLKLFVLTGRKKNTIIPVIVAFDNFKEKRKYLTLLKIGRFVSVRGKLEAVYNNYEDKTETCVFANEWLIVPVNEKAYYNSFEGLITGVTNIHRNSNGYGICCNMNIKTVVRSLTVPAIAFGTQANRMDYLKNRLPINVAGRLTVNRYDKMSIEVKKIG